jgi:hypothetical protein
MLAPEEPVPSGAGLPWRNGAPRGAGPGKSRKTAAGALIFTGIAAAHALLGRRLQEDLAVPWALEEKAHGLALMSISI